MIFDDAIEEVKAAETPPEIVVVLAKVTSTSNGKAMVQFYGESEPSTKEYPYIEGYKPVVNDVVCMLVQGNTFIIIGKVSNENITTNYNPLTSEIASTYLSQTDAANTYLSKTSATNTYLKQTDASSTYLSKTDATNTYLKQTDASSTYVKKTDNISKLENGSYSLSLGSDGKVLPSSSNSISLGSTSKYLAHVYTQEAHVRYIRIGTETTGGLEFWNNNLKPVSPGTTHGISLGSSSYQYENIYGKNIYVNGSPVSGSDRRKKKSIKDLARKYKELLFRLCPVSYKYKDGTSGRTHTGFIAQEVEQAAADVGIELKDLAAVVIEKNGDYGIRYEEFVSILTAVVQDHERELRDLHDLVTDQQAQIKELRQELINIKKSMK